MATQVASVESNDTNTAESESEGGFPVTVEECKERGRDMAASQPISRHSVVLRVKPLATVPNDRVLTTRCSICLRKCSTATLITSSSSSSSSSTSSSLSLCRHCNVTAICKSCLQNPSQTAIHDLECPSLKLLMDPTSQLHTTLFTQRTESKNGGKTNKTSGLRLLMRICVLNYLSRSQNARKTNSNTKVEQQEEHDDDDYKEEGRRENENANANENANEVDDDYIEDEMEDFHTLWDASEVTLITLL